MCICGAMLTPPSRAPSPPPSRDRKVAGMRIRGVMLAPPFVRTRELTLPARKAAGSKGERALSPRQFLGVLFDGADGLRGAVAGRARGRARVGPAAERLLPLKELTQHAGGEAAE